MGTYFIEEHYSDRTTWLHTFCESDDESAIAAVESYVISSAAFGNKRFIVKADLYSVIGFGIHNMKSKQIASISPVISQVSTKRC